MKNRTVRAAVLAVAATAMAAPAAGADPGVTPGNYSDALAPGASVTITKTVETPPIPPNPDILFLADTTGSMGGAIANVQASAGSILSDIAADQPTAQFAVGEYQDLPAGLMVSQQLTADQTAAQTAINGWGASGGGDIDEDWIGALGEAPAEVSFRADSTRVIVMFGDAPSHDPVHGFDLNSATAALQAAEIQVIAINSGVGGLDDYGQATHVTSETGGLLTASGDTGVADAILDSLENLPAEVTPSATCDTGLSATFDPATQTVTSGDSAVFDETLTLAADAPQGETLSCEVDFLVNGMSQGEAFVQSVDIEVLDVTPPEVGCVESDNPAGNQPKAGDSRPNPQGQNQDGYYEATATDNVDPDPAVYVRDTGSGHVFGPYADGQQFKYTADPDATPTEKTLGGADSGILHLIGTGDAEVFAEDASGNVSDPADCLVPAPPM